MSGIFIVEKSNTVVSRSHGRDAREVGVPCPEVDHRPAAERGGEGGAHLVAVREISLERRLQRRERLIAEPVNLDGHGHPLAVGLRPCRRRGNGGASRRMYGFLGLGGELAQGLRVGGAGNPVAEQQHKGGGVKADDGRAIDQGQVARHLGRHAGGIGAGL